MLSERSMLATNPMPSLSSGTKERATPISAMASGSLPSSSSAWAMSSFSTRLTPWRSMVTP